MKLRINPNYGVFLLFLACLVLSGCQRGKPQNGSSEKTSKKANGQVTSATAEAEVASATAEVADATPADATAASAVKSATGDKKLGKKEFVFRVPVFTEKIQRGEMKAYLSGNGTLAPEEQILIRAEIGGKLTFTQNWTEGQEVKKGTLIATIDNEDVRYLKTEALKNLQLAEERLPSMLEKRNLAIRNTESKDRLYKEGVISRLDYDRADMERMDTEISYKQALADVETRKTELEKVKYKQDRALIEAPFDGVLVRKEYLEPKQGQTSYPIMTMDTRVVSAGETLFGIFKTSQFRLDVNVSSKEIQKVELGQEADIHIYGSKVLDVTGIVTKISTALDPLTKAFKVTIQIDNPDNLSLRTGLFCKVDIIVERRMDTIRLPKEVVQTRNNRKVVFVAQGDKQEYMAEEREVKLGISNREEVEITEGIHEGDRVIIRGHETLKDKTKVKLAQADEDQTEEPQEDISGQQAGS